MEPSITPSYPHNMIKPKSDLSGYNLSGYDLRHSNLTGANLNGSDLSYSKLNGAKLQRAQLYGANLVATELWGSQLTDANLNGADLRRADFQGAELRGCDLRNTNLIDANLNGANVQGAQFEGSTGLTEAKKRSLKNRGSTFENFYNPPNIKWWTKNVIVPVVLALLGSGGIMAFIPKMLTLTPAIQKADPAQPTLLIAPQFGANQGSTSPELPTTEAITPISSEGD